MIIDSRNTAPLTFENNFKREFERIAGKLSRLFDSHVLRTMMSSIDLSLAESSIDDQHAFQTSLPAIATSSTYDTRHTRAPEGLQRQGAQSI